MATHTWLKSKEPGIFEYGIDVRVMEFIKPTNPDWLYYFALVVNFNRKITDIHLF